MKIAYFAVQGLNAYSEVNSLLEKELKKGFKSKIIEGTLFYYEDYSMMNNSDLLVVTRLQKINNSENDCEVEIVAGGGGDGILSLTFGNEKRRLNKVLDLIEDFCKFKNYNISELTITR